MDSEHIIELDTDAPIADLVKQVTTEINRI